MAAGAVAKVCESCLDPLDASMLRAMGLRPAARVRLCRLGEPCVVEVFAGGADDGHCRIGLARLLAERVMVTSLEVPAGDA